MVPGDVGGVHGTGSWSKALGCTRSTNKIASGANRLPCDAVGAEVAPRGRNKPQMFDSCEHIVTWIIDMQHMRLRRTVTNEQANQVGLSKAVTSRGDSDIATIGSPPIKGHIPEKTI